MISDALELVGAAALVYGAFRISVTAACFLGGVLVIAVGYAVSRR